MAKNRPSHRGCSSTSIGITSTSHVDLHTFRTQSKSANSTRWRCTGCTRWRTRSRTTRASIIEPIFMSDGAGVSRLGRDGGGAGVHDPDVVLLADCQPVDVLTTSGRWRCSRGMASTERPRCCSTSSGMAAIMTAVQPFLVHKLPQQATSRGTSSRRRSVTAARSSSSTCGCRRSGTSSAGG
jgi:hypothetical protein